MKKIASFTINHIKLQPGIYVSRKDHIGAETVTTFDLRMTGDLTSREALPLVRDCFRFIRDYEGEVPGASPRDCGNYLDMNLGMAKYLADKYLKEVLYDIKPERLTYPED